MTDQDVEALLGGGIHQPVQVVDNSEAVPPAGVVLSIQLWPPR